MSWEALYCVRPMTHAPNGEKLTTSEKLVMLMLAYHHSDEKRYAWPSVRLLSEETGMSPRSVKRVRRELTRKGAVEVEQMKKDNGSYGPSRYILLEVETGASCHPTGSPCPHPQGHSDTTTGSPCQGGGVTLLPRKNSERELKENLKNKEMDDPPLSLKEINLRKSYAESQKRVRR